ncbi:hypothetical protein ACFS5J_03790 [Flavobacterium chuncheonense]|uniref:Uncharacterized protein n=1 Tax=Flavobacterium chuncheonense TaxID=2026653 RepID=A0ABW5YJA0_9FLAO
MKKLLLILLFSIPTIAQKKVTIASITKKPIADALLLIDNSPKYIADSLGQVIIKAEDYNKIISIRHLNFNKRLFENWIEKDTLFLEETINELNSIELFANKKHEKLEKSLFPKSTLRNVLPENFGKSGPIRENIEVGLYFPNNEKKNEIIQRLKIYTNDYKVIENLKTKKRDRRRNAKYSPIEVNFYTVDSIYGIPKKKLFDENFIISCQKNKDCAILELSEEEQFEFPSNGIFVTIKNLPEKDYEALEFNFPPGITSIGVSKNNQIIPYFRYLHQGETALWNRDDYLIERQNAFKIGIEFKN